MPMRGHDRFFEERYERDLRYPLEEDDPHAELTRELELADRIAGEASLPLGHPHAVAAARHRLGRGPCPYERPDWPQPRRFAPASVSATTPPAATCASAGCYARSSTTASSRSTSAATAPPWSTPTSSSRRRRDGHRIAGTSGQLHVRAERPADHPIRRDDRRLAAQPTAAAPAPQPVEGAPVIGPWEAAAYAGHVTPSHPGGDRVVVEVLLRDHRGESLRLTASGFTVDDAVAAAEEHAARRFGSNHAYCDWRAR